jgi:hypothetical protein
MTQLFGPPPQQNDLGTELFTPQDPRVVAFGSYPPPQPTQHYPPVPPNAAVERARGAGAARWLIPIGAALFGLVLGVASHLGDPAARTVTPLAETQTETATVTVSVTPTEPLHALVGVSSTSSAAKNPAATSTSPEPAKSSAKGSPKPTKKPGLVFYANCAQAKAAGAAPLHLGEPGYRPALDRDRDGIACE